MRRHAVLAALVLLGGCATQRQAAAPASIGFLAFGDHGYSLDYLEAEDLAKKRTPEEFVAAARQKWLKDGRPEAEFIAPPVAMKDGTAVTASGMMAVASAMTGWCRSHDCRFGVMLGDNIYPDGATLGADGRSDAQRFQDIFVTPYGRFGWGDADFRIYGVLGNHDWHTSRAAALSEVKFLSETRPFHMDGIAYAVQPPAGRGRVEVFAFDSHVLLAGAGVPDVDINPDGSERDNGRLDDVEPWAKPATDAERRMVADLEARLKASTADWKIVIAHHPIWSSAGGKVAQARVLRRLVLPTLCRYADLVFAGHEHTLEVTTDDCTKALPGEKVAPLPAIVTGAAGKQRPLNSAFMAVQARQNPEYRSLYARGMVWGFTHVELKGDIATVTMVATPNDQSGATQEVARFSFPRRTARR